MPKHIPLARVRRTASVGATLASLIVLASLSGCMSTTPVYDQHFGESVRIVRAMQTLNPDAPNNADPGVNVNGRSSTAAMDRFNSLYQSPQSDSNGYTVGVGAAQGGLANMGR